MRARRHAADRLAVARWRGGRLAKRLAQRADDQARAPLAHRESGPRSWPDGRSRRPHRAAASRNSASMGWRPLGSEIAVSAAHGAGEQLVAHRPAIDERDTGCEAVRRDGAWAGRQSPQRRAPRARHARQARRRRTRAPRMRPSRASPWSSSPGGKARARNAVRSLGREAEGNLGMGQGQALHHIGDGRGLGALGLHEFEPRRRRIEQVAHLDARAARRCAAGLSSALTPAIDRDLVGLIGAAGAAQDREPRHGADRRQRLAAEAEGEDMGEIVVLRAWRWRGARPPARARRASMPLPSSVTRIRLRPPPCGDHVDAAWRRRRSRSRPAP